VTTKQKRPFDAQAFLDSAGVERRIVEFRRAEPIYSQGDSCDAVLYIQTGNVKLSVLSKTGKEAVVAMLGPGEFFGEGCLAGQPVRMGSATFTVAREDLAPAGTVTAVAEARPKKVGKLAALAAASRAAGRDKESDEVPAELHLLGQTVDEALPAVDRFLDGSLREARTEVRIVHGHGTGRLRSAVRAHLAGHRHVASFRPGAQGEGGDGATVVTLV
jgi:CRP-like cAMP-binding protein